jgi:hypothetical protein
MFYTFFLRISGYIKNILCSRILVLRGREREIRAERPGEAAGGGQGAAGRGRVGAGAGLGEPHAAFQYLHSAALKPAERSPQLQPALFSPLKVEDGNNEEVKVKK